MQLPDKPNVIIHWGLQTQENKKQWKDWTVKMLQYAIENPDKIEEIAEEEISEIRDIAYNEGYDSSNLDDKDSGW